MHATPAGDLPGAIVILLATIDAFAHAWDLSASVGGRYEFPDGTEPTIAAIIDATETERLMSRIGRTIPR